MRHTYPTVIALAAAAVLLAAACSGESSESSQVPMSGTPRPAGDSAEATNGHDDTHGGAHDEARPAVEAPDGTRTVEVAMNEFAYEPGTIDVAAGEPTLFVFHNEGAVEHEAMLGDAHMQTELSEAGGDHEGGHHGDVQAVTVPAGETAELLVTFDEAQTLYFACHLPGHYDAGMEATVNVT